MIISIKINTKSKISIVEDELLIAEKIERLLMSMDYELCKLVSSFEAALTMIEIEKPINFYSTLI